MVIDYAFEETPTAPVAHGQIWSSHGKLRMLWECKCKHRSGKAALKCANAQMGLAESTMYRIWHDPMLIAS